MQRTGTSPSAPAANGAPEGLEFGRYYYAHDCGTPYERNEFWLGFFDELAARIVRDLSPSSVLDAGCALGMLVEALRRHGVEAWGVDVSEFAIQNVSSSVKDYCWQASLTDPLPRHYDLVTCIEVIEHIPPDDAEVSVANLCASADRILLSSTPHDYSEPTHVNVHPPEDWAAQLARHGFLRNLDVDVTFLTEWAMLFERRPGGLPEAARQYERLLFRLQREVRELRDTTLSMQSRLEHELGDEGEEDRLREELIGTRDALIGAEASLGEALGQVRALDVELSRYKDAADRLDEVMRSSVWRFYLPYQKARSRYGARLRAVLSRLR